MRTSMALNGPTTMTADEQVTDFRIRHAAHCWWDGRPMPMSTPEHRRIARTTAHVWTSMLLDRMRARMGH